MHLYSHDALHASLSALSDEALAAKTAMGEDEPDAFRELLHRYQNTVAYLANASASTPADAEDYAQEGLLGLLAAARSYSPERGAGFRTYAVVCIRNRIRSAAKQLGSVQYAPLTEVVSLDDPENGIAETIPDGLAAPDQMFFEKEHVSELYAGLSEVLSRQEKEIFCLAVSGLSYGEIADRMQISEKSVDNAIQRARRKLRAVWSRK